MQVIMCQFGSQARQIATNKLYNLTEEFQDWIGLVTES